jgi:hypothetical protein
MRRTILATAAAVALLATTASAAAALPEDHPKAGFGKGVQFHCSGFTYGQLVKGAKDVEGHPATKGIGAKRFMLEIAPSHPGCFDNPLPE